MPVPVVHGHFDVLAIHPAQEQRLFAGQGLVLYGVHNHLDSRIHQHRVTAAEARAKRLVDHQRKCRGALIENHMGTLAGGRAGIRRHAKRTVPQLADELVQIPDLLVIQLLPLACRRGLQQGCQHQPAFRRRVDAQLSEHRQPVFNGKCRVDQHQLNRCCLVTLVFRSHGDSLLSSVEGEHCPTLAASRQ